MLIPHSTPIAPQTVNIMANTLGEMIIQFLKTNAQKEDSPKYNKIIFIDPFCGNGTIPLCIYTNPILLKMLINIGFKNINIFGMDMDESCIENCVSNLNSIKNGIPQSYASFQKFVQINFQTSSIEQIVKKLPFKISEPAIIPIITQPPYGLTIRKSESELQEIYLNLFNFASRLMEQHKIFLSFITINNQLITTILNKFKDQTDKNLISLHKTLKINKHDNEFGIFFWL